MSSGYLAGSMVAEPGDPTAPPALAMVAPAAAATTTTSSIRDGSPIFHSIAPVTAVPDDFEISDDSFTNTPSPLKKSLKPEARWRGGSRKRGSTTTTTRTIRAASVGTSSGRGMQRPPSPAVNVAPQELAHELLTPAGSSGEERLAALEAQQKHDHVCFQMLSRTLPRWRAALGRRSSRRRTCR